jgi:hypothetical protein
MLDTLVASVYVGDKSHKFDDSRCEQIKSGDWRKAKNEHDGRGHSPAFFIDRSPKNDDDDIIYCTTSHTTIPKV